MGATSLVRPNKSMIGLEVSSVRKKMKTKGFAAGVNREDLVKSAAELGVDLGHEGAYYPGMDLEEGNPSDVNTCCGYARNGSDAVYCGQSTPLVVGIDPGSKFDGSSVVGTSETVLNLMVEAPDHVKEAVEVRRTMRRARRSRKWRRPKRFDNRLKRSSRLPPSTKERLCY